MFMMTPGLSKERPHGEPCVPLPIYTLSISLSLSLSLSLCNMAGRCPQSGGAQVISKHVSPTILSPMPQLTTHSAEVPISPLCPLARGFVVSVTAQSTQMALIRWQESRYHVEQCKCRNPIPPHLPTCEAPWPWPSCSVTPLNHRAPLLCQASRSVTLESSKSTLTLIWSSLSLPHGKSEAVNMAPENSIMLILGLGVSTLLCCALIKARYGG